MHLFIYLNLNYLYNSSKRDRASKNRQNAWWIYPMYTFLHSLTSLHIKPNTVPRTTWGMGKIGSSLPADAEETTHARQSHNYLKVQNASTSFYWYSWGLRCWEIWRRNLNVSWEILPKAILKLWFKPFYKLNFLFSRDESNFISWTWKLMKGLSWEWVEFYIEEHCETD